MAEGAGNEWKNGLFGCFDDFGLCIMTFFLPCLTAGKNGEANGQSCFLCGIMPILGCIGLIGLAQLRTMTRESKGIEGSCFMDFIILMFCSCCALVQESKELSGFVPGEESMARD